MEQSNPATDDNGQIVVSADELAYGVHGWMKNVCPFGNEVFRYRMTEALTPTEQMDLKILTGLLEDHIGQGSFSAVWCSPERHDQTIATIEAELETKGITLLSYTVPNPASPDSNQRPYIVTELTRLEQTAPENAVVQIDIRNLAVDTARQLNLSREPLYELHHPKLFTGHLNDAVTLGHHAKDLETWISPPFTFTDDK